MGPFRDGTFGDRDVVHTRHGRAVAAPRNERVDLFHRTLHQRLDAPVSQIANPTAYAELTRLFRGRCTVENTLHATFDEEVKTLFFHRWFHGKTRTLAGLVGSLLIVASQTACNKSSSPEVRAQPRATSTAPQPVAAMPSSAPTPPSPSDPFAAARARMVKAQLAGRDITDSAVLAAMGRVPRHRFVAVGLRDAAYNDSPLPIGHKQTISQPYIVALMTQLAGARKGARALDVGTGSGYQAAVLAELGARVHSIEIVCPLADAARKVLDATGYNSIASKCGDGYKGWPEHAPFDVIIVAAAPNHVPKALIEQLAPGGTLVLPVGPMSLQKMVVIRKALDGTISRKTTIAVRFVPMTGEALRE